MLGIACSKFVVTLSPTSCAKVGAAAAMAMAADAAPMTDRIFIGVSPLPPVDAPPWVGKKHQERTKIVYYEARAQAASTGARPRCEDAAGRADPKGHRRGNRERRAGTGRAPAVLAGPRGAAWCRPRHRARGLRKAGR